MIRRNLEQEWISARDEEYIVSYDGDFYVDKHAESDADGNRGHREEYLEIELNEIKNKRTGRIIPINRIPDKIIREITTFVQEKHDERDLIECEKEEQADRKRDEINDGGW